MAIKDKDVAIKDKDVPAGDHAHEAGLMHHHHGHRGRKTVGTLRVKVLAGNRALRRAPVTIYSPTAGRPNFDAETDRDGMVMQSNLPAGTYRIRVSGLDDDSVEREATVTAGQTCEVLVEFRQNVMIKRESTGEVREGGEVALTAEPTDDARYDYQWSVTGGTLRPACEPAGAEPLNTAAVIWNTSNMVPGQHRVSVSVTRKDTGIDPEDDLDITVAPRPLAHGDILPVTMRRTATEPTEDLPLWFVIRKSTEALSFNNYKRFIDFVLCGDEPNREQEQELRVGAGRTTLDRLSAKRMLPFTDTDSYRLLKAATEAFLMVNCGVSLEQFRFNRPELFSLLRRHGANPGELDMLWRNYLEFVNGTDDKTVPYLALVQDKLRDGRLQHLLPAIEDSDLAFQCYGVVRSKLTNPCLIELIWSYWHEEGMLVQTLNAISRRFQNIRSGGDRDPLANLEIDPLRPLANLIWGYLQDEQHRLTVLRRTYEYDHHYGVRLFGKAVPDFRPADSRSRFIEAFHHLLFRASVFFAQDDDTTVVADGFPVLNALKEVHLLLSEGAHNQFGDLTSTARIEMLMQEWLLARPEFREFLPTRAMVAYPEPWMDRVDAMKRLQGWTDTNILHFRNLGIFGEQILLSVRFGNWNDAHDAAQAANWARFWRAEIQGYAHAYRAVTSADITSEPVDTTLPAILLERRLSGTRTGGAPLERPMLPATAVIVEQTSAEKLVRRR